MRLGLGLGLQRLGAAGESAPAAPVITSSSSVSVAENATLSHALTADQEVTWSIVGGADQAQFEISGSTLRWAGNGTQDYEDPADADTDNAYVVTVRATNETTGLTADQTITATVTDVAEAAIVHRASLSNTGTGLTATFNDVPIGDADANRLVVVSVTSERSSGAGVVPSHTLSAVTINGNAASIIGQQNHTQAQPIYTVGMAQLAVSTGADCDIAVTFTGSGTLSRITIHVYTIDLGVYQSTPFDFGGASAASSSAAALLDVASNGAVIAAGASGEAMNITMSGVTEDQEISADGEYRTCCGSQTGLGPETDRSVGISVSVNRATVFAASWQPT